MSTYEADKAFTDTVHRNLALRLIYEPLNWVAQDVNEQMHANVDRSNGIDYFLIDVNRTAIVTTQERFREVRYKNFTDFTVRFEREYNPHEDRRLSEYYKLNADYFVYGIINVSKADVERATDFVKYAVIDIAKFKRLLDTGGIVVDRSLRSYNCVRRNNTICCPVNYNKDDSSSFIPVDIPMLLQLHPDAIVRQRGYGGN